MTVVENGKRVECPVCGSNNVIRVHPFDYVKQCENPDCPYHTQNKKGYKYQWSTGVHN